MIITKYVMYRGKKKKVEDLSPTSGYKVEAQCPICGKVRTVFYRSICAAGHTKCQACSAKEKSGKTLKSGSKFGRLTVIKPAEKSGRSVCKCDCGTIKEFDNWLIKSGKTQSCGCLKAEHIRKVSYNPKGKDHWHWKGGITKERQSVMSQKTYKDWRSKVFERDEYTCQKCGKVGRKLRAHHIYGFAEHPDLRLATDNGITFCEKCHREFHSINGFSTNLEQLNIYLERG